MRFRVPRPILWLGVVIGIIGLLYCASVYSMAASFSVSNPEHLSYWRRIAIRSLIGAGLSLALSVASGLALVYRLLRFRLPAA